MCGTLVFLVALMLLAPNNSHRDSDFVVNVPIATELNAAEQVTVEKEFECPDDGTYWVQIRYSLSLREIDSRLPKAGRKFGSAVITAFNLSPELRVKESESESELTPKKITWKPTETSSKTAKYAADRFELKLHSNTRYRLRFTVNQPSKTWVDLNPTLVVEPSHALRNNRAAKAAKSPEHDNSRAN